MSNDISPPTAAAVVPAPVHPIEAGSGKKNGSGTVDHEEYGNETEMDDMRKPTDDQRIEVTPEDVSRGSFSSRLHGADRDRIEDCGRR